MVFIFIFGVALLARVIFVSLSGGTADCQVRLDEGAETASRIVDGQTTHTADRVQIVRNTVNMTVWADEIRSSDQLIGLVFETDIDGVMHLVGCEGGEK